MILDYLEETSYTKQLEIEDIGNVILKGTSDGINYFYFLTKTIMGTTWVLKAGPVFPDITDSFVPGFTLSVEKLKFNDKKLISKIDDFVNGRNNLIDVYNIEDPNEIFEELPQIKEAFINIQ